MAAGSEPLIDIGKDLFETEEKITMQQSNVILSNAVIIWISRAFMLVPQLFLAPYLINSIGEEGYGIYVLIWALLMSIEQLQRSLQSGVVKYSAGLLAQEKINEVNKVISSSFVYSILLSVVAFATMLTMANMYDDPTGKVGNGLYVLSAALLFVFPLTPYVAVIQSRQCFYVSAIAEVISKYGSLGIILLWFNLIAPSLESLLIIMSMMLFLGRVVQVPFAYRLVPGLHLRFKNFDKKQFRLIFGFGAGTVLASICLAIDSAGIRWLMATLSSSVFVAHLAIMLMPSMLVNQVIGPLTMIFMPATSAYSATGNTQKLQQLFREGMRYTMFLILIILIVATILMEKLIALWISTEYKFLAPFSIILLACEGFRIGTSPAHHMLKGMGEIRSVVIIYWLSLVIVPICVIFGVFQIWGDPYAAVTAGLATGRTVCGCLQIVISSTVINVKLNEIVVGAYLQPLAFAAVVSLIALSLTLISGMDGLLGRLVITVLAVISFLGGMYTLAASPAERQKAKELILKFSRKIGLAS